MLLFRSCFISDLRLLYGLFLVPIFIIVIFNTVILVLVTRVLLKHKNKRKNGNSTKGTLKTIFSIVSVMAMYGLSWLFGIVSVSNGAIVFQWLFNTTQGFSLFLIFCVINEEGRQEWRNLLLCKNKQKPKPMSYPIGIQKPKRHLDYSNQSRQTKDTIIYNELIWNPRQQKVK